MFTPVQPFYLNVLNAYKTDKLATPFITVKLFSNNFTPIEGSVEGDFTESTFTGYVEQTGVAFLADVINGDGSVSSVMGGNVQFLQTATTISELAYGYYLLDNDGDLIGGEKFNAPINFNAIGVGLRLSVAITAGPAGITFQNTPLTF